MKNEFIFFFFFSLSIRNSSFKILKDRKEEIDFVPFIFPKYKNDLTFSFKFFQYMRKKIHTEKKRKNKKQKKKKKKKKTN